MNSNRRQFKVVLIPLLLVVLLHTGCEQRSLPQGQHIGDLGDRNSKEGLIRVGKDLSNEKQFIDFGLFVANESVARSITIENATSHVLTPESVNASCGCIVANLPVIPIPPGKTVKLDVTIRADAGDFIKNMEVRFQELSKPTDIQLTGHAKSRFTIVPNEVNLSAKKLTAMIELTPAFGDSLEHVACRSTGGLVKIEVNESRNDRLLLIVTPSEPKDNFWQRAHSTIESIELRFPDNQIVLLDLCVNSAVGISIFPRIVSLKKVEKSDVTVFRKDSKESPKFLRFVIDGKSMAHGVLTSQAKGSALTRYALHPVNATENPGTFANAVVEESGDEIEWREIGLVTVVYE